MKYVNCFRHLIIGVLWGILTKNTLSEPAALLLMTGFCGGFTTFSAFTLESLQILNNGRWGLFLFYIISSVLGGLLATFAGYKIMN